MSTYQFDHEWKKERGRLANMEAVFDPMTTECLEMIGVGEGWKCLEVGAPPHVLPESPARKEGR